MSGRQFVFVMLLVNAAIFTMIFWPRIDEWAFGPDCDAVCQQLANQFIEDNAPEVFETPGTGNEFNPEKFIVDALNGP